MRSISSSAPSARDEMSKFSLARAAVRGMVSKAAPRCNAQANSVCAGFSCPANQQTSGSVRTTSCRPVRTSNSRATKAYSRPPFMPVSFAACLARWRSSDSVPDVPSETSAREMCAPSQRSPSSPDAGPSRRSSGLAAPRGAQQLLGSREGPQRLAALLRDVRFRREFLPVWAGHRQSPGDGYLLQHPHYFPEAVRVCVVRSHAFLLLQGSRAEHTGTNRYGTVTSLDLKRCASARLDFRHGDRSAAGSAADCKARCCLKESGLAGFKFSLG